MGKKQQHKKRKEGKDDKKSSKSMGLSPAEAECNTLTARIPVFANLAGIPQHLNLNIQHCPPDINKKSVAMCEFCSKGVESETVLLLCGGCRTVSYEWKAIPESNPAIDRR